MKRLAFLVAFTMMCTVAFSQSNSGYFKSKSGEWNLLPESRIAAWSDTVAIYDSKIHFIKIDGKVFEIIRSITLSPVSPPVLSTTWYNGMLRVHNIAADTLPMVPVTFPVNY